MFDRRRFISTLGLLCVSSSWAQANDGDEPSHIEQEIDAWIKDPSHADYFKLEEDRGTQRGSLRLAPDDAHVKWAAQYLSSVPKDRAPIDIAKYMIRTIPSQYIMEWPPDTPATKTPANPLIVAFFSATRTIPTQGDETAWCAAFACWTLKHCGLPYPNSAGSKSFRDFEPLPPTADPQVGDLVVFKHTNKPDNGHVAFFDGFANSDGSKIWCVGGNQGNKLSRKQFPVKGELHVVSYRTGNGLRSQS